MADASLLDRLDYIEQTGVHSLNSFVNQPVFMSLVKGLQVALSDCVLFRPRSLLQTSKTDLLGEFHEIHRKHTRGLNGQSQIMTHDCHIKKKEQYGNNKSCAYNYILHGTM